MLKRIGLVLLASLLLVGLTAGPSSAKSKTVHDKRGESTLGQAADIRKAVIRNGRRAVVVRGFLRPTSDLPIICTVRIRRG